MNNKKIKVFRYELIVMIWSLCDFYNYIIQGVFTDNKALLNKAILMYIIIYLVAYIFRKMMMFTDSEMFKEIEEDRNKIINKYKQTKKHLLNKISAHLTKKIENL